MEKIQAGSILIADPFLKDPNFLRTVIFLCEHQNEGSFGFVLNRKLEYAIGDLVNEHRRVPLSCILWRPSSTKYHSFLHRCNGLITGGQKVTNDIYWGGEFEDVISLLQNDRLSSRDIRLFIGYSGWGEGQLNEEFSQKTWLTTFCSDHLVFGDDANQIWKDALKQLGGKYEQLVHYPIDPQLN
jgi:putative transcriptional regulator